MTYPGFVGPGADARLADPEKELLSIAYDGARPGSLQWTLDALQHVSRTVRDRISSDTWRVLNRLKLREVEARASELSEEAAAISEATPETADTLSDLLESIEDLVISLTAFSGLAMESMTRGPGWRFLELGRQLERTAHTISLLNVHVDEGERRRGAAVGGAAGDRREFHDLPPALPEQRSGRAGAGPSAGR